MKQNRLLTFILSLLSAALAGVLCAGFTAQAVETSVKPELPPLPAIELPQNRLSAQSKIQVSAFVLEGNQVFSNEELLAAIQSYSGREISAEELQEVRNILSKYYIDRGYINSGAIIPDQEINATQQIKIQIIEGHLSQIHLTNAADLKLKERYITSRLEFPENAALNTNELQERLQILQQNPLVKRFNAELGPGIRAGDAVLNLEITEDTPYELHFDINNHRSPSVGATRAELSGRHRNLTGWGDSLSGRIGLAEGLADYSLNYALPITHYDTTLELKAEQSDSQVIAEPFNQLDITSKAETYGISLRHPFYKAYTKDFHYRVFDMSLGLEKRHSETKLLGELFPFPPVVDGVNKITALRFSQNWLDRSRDQVVAFASTFGVGMDALDSSIHDDISNETGLPSIEPDSEFVTWLGQFRWINRVSVPWDKSKDSQLWLRADMQYSNDPLLPLEKFAIGGASTVRGYRENQLTRDKGAVLSLEWQLPIAHWRIQRLSKENEGEVLLAPFLDYGWGDNNKFATTGTDSLASVGLGVIWNASSHLRAELYWGHRLKEVDKPEDKNLQDNGIHFSLELSL